MSVTSVFIILLSLIYLPLADSSNLKDFRDLPGCSESYSDQKENYPERAAALLSQIGRLSMTRVAEILKSEHPETLRILSRQVFRSNRMDRAKYNLAFALGENQTDDPELHRILSEALLFEKNRGVQREIAHALGRINGKIDSSDSQIQWNLVKVIQSQTETGIKLKAIYALGETRSKDTAIHWVLVKELFETEITLIRQEIVKAFFKMEPTDLEISQTLLTALLSEETTGEIKQAAAEVLSIMPPLLDPKKQQEMSRFLSLRVEFDTEPSIELKQKVAEIIKKTESRDTKTHQLLAEALTAFKGTKYAQVREEIYDLFESVPQYIKGKNKAAVVGFS